MISFASDNWSEVHPAVMTAIRDANRNFAHAYGGDVWTIRFEDLVRREFGSEAVGFPVLNGTAANVLSVASVCRPHEFLLCADTAHMHVHEAGASERFAGCKLKTVSAVGGKLSVERLRSHVKTLFPQDGKPAAVSITQATEMGTVYSIKEIQSLSKLCHENGLYLHMDGARFANAAATLGVSLKALTADAGVDVVSFGGTKNGLMLADAVIFLNPELARDFNFIRLQGLNLASKMRYVSAQLVTYLQDGLWLKNAQHANAMARRLDEKIRDVAGVEVLYPVEANLLFVRLPGKALAPLKKEFSFFEMDPKTHEVRLVTSWNTTEEQVDAFADALRRVCSI